MQNCGLAIVDADDEFMRTIVCQSIPVNDDIIFKCQNVAVFEDCLVYLDIGYCTACGYYCGHVLYCLDNEILEDNERSEDILNMFAKLKLDTAKAFYKKAT